ncbi:SDR family NAD(P)-dependent oxidoreductase [Nocardia nova]|uniref:SDR family NAD(P)-dependent oxidoreductase n=1 Tax=Nocardia nova TaxID=37330 RepID=UPI0033E89349
MGVREVDDGVIVLLGGRSEMGLEVVRRICAGRDVVLAARRSADLAGQRAEIERAGARAVAVVEFDADALDTHQPLLERLAAEYGRIGVAVLAFGVLGDQDRAEKDPAAAVAILKVDFLAQVSVLTVLANLLRAQGSGQMVVFSSVAGIRVRRANYVYGSGKAGLDGFASGLSDALHGSGVHLLLVRPGFVIGKMTEGMRPAPLSRTPEQVADAVAAALRRRKARVWVPGALRYAFAVARLVPQPIWRRMPR